MRGRRYGYLTTAVCAAILTAAGCASVPIKQYYVLNYRPSSLQERINHAPYPVSLRLKELEIEEAYARPQIVYRQSPFKLEYYFYRVWAVKPTRMITDLVQKHLLSERIVSQVVRRFDEGANPDYEVSGTIEAIEEYDSEDTWFAHMALRFSMTRIRDGRLVYTRYFDHRKQVFRNDPENVIRELSAVMEYVMNQFIRDLDVTLARELGTSVSAPAPVISGGPDSPAAE